MSTWDVHCQINCQKSNSFTKRLFGHPQSRNGYFPFATFCIFILIIRLQAIDQMLQYYGVFGLLILEAVLLLLFFLPLGRFGLNISLKIVGAIKVPAWFVFALLTFFTVGIFANNSSNLFLQDQTMDMRRHEEKLHALPPNTPLDKEQHLREQKFRSERNFYLTLFTTTLLL
jgi:hypothetical protein